MKPQAVEFLVHMSLATAAAAVNSLADDVMVDEIPNIHYDATIGTQDERYQVREFFAIHTREVPVSHFTCSFFLYLCMIVAHI